MNIIIKKGQIILLTYDRYIFIFFFLYYYIFYIFIFLFSNKIHINATLEKIAIINYIHNLIILIFFKIIF